MEKGSFLTAKRTAGPPLLLHFHEKRGPSFLPPPSPLPVGTTNFHSNRTFSYGGAELRFAHFESKTGQIVKIGTDGDFRENIEKVAKL